MKNPSQLFVISGPSGVGKSTIIEIVRERIEDLGYSISYASRKPRRNEINGVDYHFVDRETFNSMVDEGAFLEWAQVYNNLYGTSISTLRDQTDQGLDIIMDLDSGGAKNVKKYFKDSLLIFILPPSLESLKKRLTIRATDSKQVISERVEKAVQGLKDCAWYDYIIVNDDLERTVGAVKSIIMAERSRRFRMLPKVEEIMNF